MLTGEIQDYLTMKTLETELEGKLSTTADLTNAFIGGLRNRRACSSVEWSWTHWCYLYWIAKNPTRMVLNHSKNLVDKRSAYQMRPAVHYTVLWKVQVWTVGQPCPTCYYFTRILWLLHSLLANKGQGNEHQFSHWQKRFLAVEGKATAENQ